VWGNLRPVVGDGYGWWGVLPIVGVGMGRSYPMGMYPLPSLLAPAAGWDALSGSGGVRRHRIKCSKNILLGDDLEVITAVECYLEGEIL
jgi:hypothetical protein